MTTTNDNSRHTPPYTIYFAGPLFDHKHLAGNALLAAHIDAVSDGVYRCILPQDLEQRGVSAMEIRDQDLLAVMECDLALFNFDGSELGSGAVVEYMYAKMLDIPCVILRTDFRHGGDQQNRGSDPWNLMASFYPRTRIVHLDGMQWYQDALAQGGDAPDVAARYHRRIAIEANALLDDARNMQPVMQGGRAGAEREYRWALRMAGGSLSALADDAAYVSGVVGRKIALGLLPE